MAMYMPIFRLMMVLTSWNSSEHNKTCQIDTIHVVQPQQQLHPIKKEVLDTRTVSCSLKERVLLDITWALDKFIEAKKMQADVEIVCNNITELHFVNPKKVIMNNILLTLKYRGGCKMHVESFAVWARATQLQVIQFAGKRLSFASTSQDTNYTTKELKNIAVIRAVVTSFKNVPGMLFKTHVWPNLAYVALWGESIDSIPIHWHVTMPSLQSLIIYRCKLKQPPQFPWNNYTLEMAPECLKYDPHYNFPDVQADRNTLLRRLMLDGNYIEDLSTHQFRGFLQILSIRRNGLKRIGRNCFHNLTGIQEIDLSWNKLTYLYENMFQGLTSLRIIILSKNNISSLGKEMFKGMNNSLRRIYLDHNNLNHIPDGLFKSLRSLRFLRLGSNKIAEIEKNPFPRNAELTFFDLQHNTLSSFPHWVFHLHNIRKIDLSYNRLTVQVLKTAVDCFAEAGIVPLYYQFISLNLAFNNISKLIDSEELGRIRRNRTRKSQYLKFFIYVVIKLNGNPLDCECNMFNLKKLLPRTRLGIMQTWRCYWPRNLRGKPILEIKEEHWVYSKVLNCPAECLCYKRCTDGIIVVNCQKRNLTTLPNSIPQGLVELNLQDNEIIDIPAYPYLVNVTILILTNNKVEQLHAKVIWKLIRIRSLLMDYNKLTSLPREIKSLNFRTLFLGQNFFKCDCESKWMKKWLRRNKRKIRNIENWRCYWPRHLRGKPILEIKKEHWVYSKALNCPAECLCYKRCTDGIIVVNCQKRNLTTLPNSIPQGLVELNLRDNEINDIPAYPYLVNVTILILTNNKVEQLHAKVIRKLIRIRSLLMDYNKLTSLPREIKSLNFTTLSLEQNFFKCDCKSKWMKQWLWRNNRKIPNIENLRCISKQALGQALYTLPDNKFICLKNKTSGDIATENIVIVSSENIVIVSSVLGSLLVVIVTAIVLFYRYLSEVKVFMFTHFNWHPFDRIDDSDPSKIYDAFLSYCNADCRVSRTLVERLENYDPPYKLCLHMRNFIPGIPISENIFNGVDQSKRMIILLSPTSAKSGCCLLEFRAAHRKVLEDRMNYLIIILFDDVDMADVDDEIKLYIRTNTYLSLSDKWFWRKLFYAMPQPSACSARREGQEEAVAFLGGERVELPQM